MSKPIMKPCSIPDDLTAAFREFEQIMEVPSDSSIEKIQTDLQKLEEDPLRVAVIGCFSTGKSTLINALVGAKECETGKLPVTMKLRRIPYQNGDRIELIDTMGVDAMDFPKHKEETGDAIAKADAVIYVVSANNLGTTGDKDIGNMLRACKTSGILVVTHWDQVEEIQDQKAIHESAQKLAKDFFPQQDAKLVFFIDAKHAESQRALKKAVVQSNNSDFVKLEKCIQTKLADKDNKQRIKLSNVLNNLLSVVQKKVHLLTQRRQEFEHKKWDTEYEQIHEQYKEKSERLREKIRFQNRLLVSAKNHLTDVQKASNLAIQPCKALLHKAEKDAAEDGGAWKGALKGAAGGAAVGSVVPGIGNVLGALIGGAGGGLAGNKMKQDLERIVRTRWEDLQNEQAKHEPLVKRMWAEVDDHKHKLKKLEEEEEQLQVKRDEAKNKVDKQKDEACKAQERCQMLIRYFEKHLDTIREQMKDHRSCL